MSLGGELTVLLIASAGAAAFGLLFLLGVILVGARRDKTRKRLAALEERWSRSASVSAAASLRRAGTETRPPGFDGWLQSWLPKRDALKSRLSRTGRSISITQYVLFSICCGLCVALLARLVFGIAAPLAILKGVSAGLALPHFVVGRLIAGRASKFINDFPEAIDLIVRGLKSGLPIQETISTIGQEMPDPVGIEFRNVESALQLGQTLDEALWVSATRLDIPEFRFFVISLSVQRETGGNLAETLENLSDLLRRRRQMKLKIRALSSEARASAYIIGSLPFIMVLILYFLNRGYLMQLFTDPRGLFLVGAGLTSIGIGAVVMGRMVRFEI